MTRGLRYSLTDNGRTHYVCFGNLCRWNKSDDPDGFLVKSICGELSKFLNRKTSVKRSTNYTK